MKQSSGLKAVRAIGWRRALLAAASAAAASNFVTQQYNNITLSLSRLLARAPTRSLARPHARPRQPLVGVAERDV